MQQLQPGATLQNGKYIIERVLGQGGFGITYLATHSILEKQVAIKEFFPKDFCERDSNTSHITLGNVNTTDLVAKLKDKFLKEAKNISKLSHPNIVVIHDIFEENGTAYYLMDFIDGISLNDLIKRDGALDEPKALDYIRRIGSAIEYMHSKSMNHLDVKPANIMLRSADNTPILIDFGLAKQYDSTGDQTSTSPVGISHGFAPIEQYRPGGVATFTPQTDIYALGATLFALLTANTPPHYSDILEEGLPELPSTVSQKTATAIEKAMETKKIKRPATIEAFISLLPDAAKLPIEPTRPAAVEEKTTGNTARPKPIERKNNTPAEETVVLLNVPLSQQTKNNETSDIPCSIPDNSFQYLDLGLSVKWATKLSGTAIPDSNGDSYKFLLQDGSIITPFEFLNRGNELPTTKHLEELLERCCWTTFEENDMYGYKITGPNGNVLMMPLGILNRYLSKECIRPDSLYYYFLYLGEYTHTLAKGVLTEANIWTVQDY